MAIDINEFLARLDPSNDEHWTADGLPRMDVLHVILGKDTMTRQDLTGLAPEFTREVAIKLAAEADGNPPADDQSEPEADADADVDADAEDQPKASGGVMGALRDALGSKDDDQAEPEPDADADADAEDQAEPEPEPEAEAELEAPAELSKYDKLQLKLADATEVMYAQQKIAKEAKEAADEAANEVNALNRKIEVCAKTDPNHATAGVRAYLNQQNKNRLERAQGQIKLRELLGMTQGDVAKTIDPRAPIDREMRVRKPGMGQGRPKYPHAVVR